MIDWKALREKIQPDLIIGCVAGLLAVLLFHQCNERKVAESEIQRLNEAMSLEQRGAPPAKPTSEKELRADLEGEKKTSAVLRIALADAERRVKEATGKPPKVIEVVKWKTIPGPAGGTPPPGRDALISPGDELTIKGTSVKLETKAGNHVITGTAAVWRLNPLPETLIYEGAVELGSVKAQEVKDGSVTVQRRWSFGGVGTIDTSGNWAVGPKVGYSLSRIDLSLGMTFPDQRTIGSVAVRW